MQGRHSRRRTNELRTKWTDGENEFKSMSKPRSILCRAGLTLEGASLLRCQTVDSAVTAHAANRAIGATFRIGVGEESDAWLAATNRVSLQPVVAVRGPGVSNLNAAGASGIGPIAAPSSRLDALTRRTRQNVVVVHLSSVRSVVGDAVFIR